MSNASMRNIKRIIVTPDQVRMVKKELSKSYINYDAQVDAIAVAFNNGENIYFVGEPGWGKTTIAKEMMRLLGIPFFDSSVQNGLAKMFNIIKPGMTAEEVALKSLIPSLDVYKEPSIMLNGKLVKPKVTILDELPDAKSSQLDLLKVFLEEGFLPNTNTAPGFVDNIFIGAGNKTREDTTAKFKSDPMFAGHLSSLEAVWERFPRELTVQWPATRKDWQNLARLSITSPQVVEIIGDITEIMEKYETMSPRKVDALINVFRDREEIINDNNSIMAQFSTLKIGNFSVYAEEIVTHIKGKKLLKDKKLEFEALDKKLRKALEELFKANLSPADKFITLSEMATKLRSFKYSMGNVHDNDVIKSLIDLIKIVEEKTDVYRRAAIEDANKGYVNAVNIALSAITNG